MTRMWAFLPAAILLVAGFWFGAFHSGFGTVVWFSVVVLVVAGLGLQLWRQVEAANPAQPLNREETLKLVSIFGVVAAAMIAAAGFVDSANNELRKPLDALTVNNCNALIGVLAPFSRLDSPWSREDRQAFEKFYYGPLLLTESFVVADGMRTLKSLLDKIESRPHDQPHPGGAAEGTDRIERDAKTAVSVQSCVFSIVQGCRLQLNEMRLSSRDILPLDLGRVLQSRQTSDEKNTCPGLLEIVSSPGSHTREECAQHGQTYDNGYCYVPERSITESALCEKSRGEWIGGMCYKRAD
jgi:hypothetical protein